MELLQLRYFYECACYESISKTAEQFMVPPSSVSVSIKRLETELGCALFDRKSNRLVLNKKGRKLQNALATILPLLDNTVLELTEPLHEEHGDIYLLIRSERKLLVDCISDFRKEYPDVTFHILHDFTIDQISQFDIIIDDAFVSYPGFHGTPIIRESIRIAASSGNPLCGRALTMADLRNKPFLTIYQGGSLHRITIDCCRRAGFEPNIIIECDDPLYLRKYVELDFGIAFVPESSWEGQLNGLRFLDVVDLKEQRVTAAHINIQRPINSIARKFYDMLLQQQSQRTQP